MKRPIRQTADPARTPTSPPLGVHVVDTPPKNGGFAGNRPIQFWIAGRCQFGSCSAITAAADDLGLVSVRRDDILRSAPQSAGRRPRGGGVLRQPVARRVRPPLLCDQPLGPGEGRALTLPDPPRTRRGDAMIARQCLGCASLPALSQERRRAARDDHDTGVSGCGGTLSRPAWNSAAATARRRSARTRMRARLWRCDMTEPARVVDLAAVTTRQAIAVLRPVALAAGLCHYQS